MVFLAGIRTGSRVHSSCRWKTNDYERTWRPIFDSAPAGSIGDIGVSWSNPDIIYVGTGEGLHRPDLVGDDIFKVTDGGESWKHVGLPDVQQVGRLIVHLTDPNIVYGSMWNTASKSERTRASTARTTVCSSPSTAD